MVFKSALRLARGGIRYEMGNRTQAALLSDSRVASELEKGFGGASCKGQGATILLQCAPVHFDPEDPAAIGRFEFENKLNKGDVLSMTWCKPPHKRKPEQTMAVLKLKMRSHDLADRLITEGGQLDYTRVLFRKATQEPTRCLRCQNYGHKAASCKTGPNDVCSRCGEAHRIANCTNGDKKWCVPCQSDAHCSYDRDCPTFRSECTKFNTRRPKNSSALFGLPRPYDPRQRPINHPLPPILPEMLIGEGHASLFAAQSRAIRDMNSRPNWTSREQSRKEFGSNEAWEEVDGRILTAPLVSATGSNAIALRSPRLPPRALMPPPRAHTPSLPEPSTPERAAEILGIPATPACGPISFDGIPLDISPVIYARARASSNASTATVTQ